MNNSFTFKFNIFFIIFICALIFWLSNFNSNILYLVNYKQKIDYTFNLNFFVTLVKSVLIPISILLIGILSLIIFFLKKKKIKDNKLLIVFILFNVTITIGLFTSGHYYNFNDYLYSLSFSIFFFCFLFFLKNISTQQQAFYLIFANLFVIITYASYHIVNFNFFYGDITFHLLKNTIKTNSNGISKYLVIIQILLLSTLYFKKSLNIFNRYFLLTTIVFFYFLIFSFESRLNSISIVIISFAIIFISNLNKFKLIRNNLIMLIISIILYSFYINNYPQNANYDQSRLKNTLNEITQKNQNFFDIIVNSPSLNIRINTWNTLIKNKKNYLFGNGHQYDRHVLRSLNNKNIGKEAANAFIYSFISGGIIAFCILIFLYYLILKQIYLFFKKKNKIDILTSFCILSIIYFILRSIIEVSFVSWGTDAIIFFSNLSYFKHRYS